MQPGKGVSLAPRTVLRVAQLLVTQFGNAVSQDEQGFPQASLGLNGRDLGLKFQNIGTDKTLQNGAIGSEASHPLTKHPHDHGQ